MLLTGYLHFRFTAMMYLVLEDQESEQGVLTYIKDVKFDFADDPTAPRQVIMSRDPLPTTTQLSAITDRYGVQPLPGAIYTITSIEPVMTLFGNREVFRHQAALTNPLNFGYEGIVRGSSS